MGFQLCLSAEHACAPTGLVVVLSIKHWNTVAELVVRMILRVYMNAKIDHISVLYQ